MCQPILIRPRLVIYVAFALLAWHACHAPSPSSDSTPSASHAEAVDANPSNPVCYLHTSNEDSVKLHITSDRRGIRGKMHFKNYQIDGSKGVIRGKFHGDTLFVLYDFIAEGSHSITEEAFLKRGGTYVRGFGEREEMDGVHRFTDNRGIDFSNGQVFVPVRCTDGFGDL